MNRILQQPKPWKPDRPTSKGATTFHDAVINASWNHQCVDALIDIAKPNIHEKIILPIDPDRNSIRDSRRIRPTQVISRIYRWLRCRILRHP